jgi:hypothetical protein
MNVTAVRNVLTQAQCIRHSIQHITHASIFIRYGWYRAYRVLPDHLPLAPASELAAQLAPVKDCTCTAALTNVSSGGGALMPVRLQLCSKYSPYDLAQVHAPAKPDAVRVTALFMYKVDQALLTCSALLLQQLTCLSSVTRLSASSKRCSASCCSALCFAVTSCSRCLLVLLSTATAQQ